MVCATQGVGVNSAQANSAIKLSALVVGGIYLYRHFAPSPSPQTRQPSPLGRFIVAWSVLYFGLSLAAGPAPGVAGPTAVLVACASLLANGIEVSKDLRHGLGETSGQQRRGPAGTTGPIGVGRVGANLPSVQLPTTETETV